MSVAIDVSQPVAAVEAKKLVRSIMETGRLEFTRHALEEMANDGMTPVDVENVLRGGTVFDPEWENGAWRYRAETRRFCVVFEFDSETEAIVVTAWRFKP